jgi:hypothetical protein
MLQRQHIPLRGQDLVQRDLQTSNHQRQAHSKSHSVKSISHENSHCPHLEESRPKHYPRLHASKHQVLQPYNISTCSRGCWPASKCWTDLGGHVCGAPRPPAPGTPAPCRLPPAALRRLPPPAHRQADPAHQDHQVGSQQQARSAGTARGHNITQPVITTDGHHDIDMYLLLQLMCSAACR